MSELYAWKRCTHEGIGLPGCSTCDPDKYRVSQRYEFLLGEQRARVRKQLDALELGWGVIANAGGGDWKRESPEWQEAAKKWRDLYHALLAEGLR